MKTWIKRFLSACLCTAILVSFTGCWNRRELNTLAIVMGLGIDKSSMPNEIQLTAQIVNSGNIPTPAKGGSSSEKAFFNVESTGTDVFSILRDDTHKVSRKLYIPQNQLIVVGDELAEDGMRNYFDLFFRDHEARLNVNILIAKGRAEDVLNVQPEFSKVPAMHISQLITMQQANSQTASLTVFDLLKAWNSSSSSVVAPMVQVQADSEVVDVVSISGGAVIKGDKMVGTLNKQETRGMLWVKGKVQGGLVQIPVNKGQAVLEIVSASSKMKPVLSEDGKIKMQVKIKVVSTLGSQSGPENLADAKNFPVLRQKMQDEVRHEITLSLKKAQKLSADYFDFGNEIYRYHPKEWKTMEKDWDKIFKTLPVEVEVEADVVRAGRTAKMGNPKGSK